MPGALHLAGDFLTPGGIRVGRYKIGMVLSIFSFIAGAPLVFLSFSWCFGKLLKRFLFTVRGSPFTFHHCRNLAAKRLYGAAFGRRYPRESGTLIERFAERGSFHHQQLL